MRHGSSYRLLTRLFLRQFLENDLLSPDADRSQMLAITGASLISLTLFISMFFSARYAMIILAPGQAAVLSLDDKFFYVSLAMLVTALAAAGQWDALSLDQRDTAILQPLPVRDSTLRLAKLTAVAILGSAVALAINAFPTWVFPWMLAFAVPQMSGGQLFGMMAAHAVTTILAAAFGYLTVIAIRESASALLGPRLFAIASPALQTTIIVGLGVALLLLPVTTTRVAQRGFDGWRAALPPMAFVGAYEVVTGGFLAELPRRPMRAWQQKIDRQSAALYDERRQAFPLLARRAQVLFAAVAISVALATALNALRPAAAAVVAPRSRRRSRTAGLAPLLFSQSAARAGFDFAVATLWRSKTHRLTLACAAAIGFAAVLVALSRIDLSSPAVSARLLAIQPLLYGSLLVGFRHLVRVPAELRANWGIEMAWHGRVREFAFGARIGALLTLAVPAILIVMPPVAVVAGVPLALAHAALGCVGAVILLDALMLSYDKVPFTCTYLPGTNMRALAPIYAGAFLIGASMFANLQLSILTGQRTFSGTAGLLGLMIALRYIASHRPHPAVEFNEVPVTFHQLGLHS